MRLWVCNSLDIFLWAYKMTTHSDTYKPERMGRDTEKYNYIHFQSNDLIKDARWYFNTTRTTGNTQYYYRVCQRMNSLSTSDVVIKIFDFKMKIKSLNILQHLKYDSFDALYTTSLKVTHHKWLTHLHLITTCYCFILGFLILPTELFFY